MVARRDTPGSSDADGGFLGRIGNALENRLAMIFVAAVLGAGGGLGLVRSNPEVRADPFTGTMGVQLEQRVMAHCDDNVYRLERELTALKHQLAERHKTSDLYRHKVTRNEEKIASLGQAITLIRSYMGFSVSHQRYE